MQISVHLYNIAAQSHNEHSNTHSNTHTRLQLILLSIHLWRTCQIMKHMQHFELFWWTLWKRGLFTQIFSWRVCSCEVSRHLKRVAPGRLWKLEKFGILILVHLQNKQRRVFISLLYSDQKVYIACYISHTHTHTLTYSRV